MDVVDRDIVASTFDRILNAIEGTYEQAQVALPERRYLYFGVEGETVHDNCEQLTISLAQMYQGGPGEQGGLPARCDTALTGVFIVEVVRCIPDKLKVNKGTRATPPNAADLSMNAKAQGIDGFLLMLAGLQAGEDFLGSLVNVTAGPASGGFQAVVLELATGLY